MVAWGTTVMDSEGNVARAKEMVVSLPVDTDDLCYAFRKQSDVVMIEVRHVEGDYSGDGDPRFLFCKNHVFYCYDIGKFFRVGKIKEDLEISFRIIDGKGCRTFLKDTGQEKEFAFFNPPGKQFPFPDFSKKIFLAVWSGDMQRKPGPPFLSRLQWRI